MKTLLIGERKLMEDLYPWLQRSDEVFEISMIISETDIHSNLFECDIKPVSELMDMTLDYDVVFLCSKVDWQWRETLSMMGVDEKRIKSAYQICEYLTPEDCMEYHKEDIRIHCGKPDIGEQVDVGDFTYGRPSIQYRDAGKKLMIGKFCSIAPNVTILLGGNHRSDWCTTYPFNVLMREFSYIEGHPASNGDVVIGNDVWIGSNAKIMSGVTIGDGCVIAANAVVTKDVSPYTVVGGLPAKKIRDRFSRDIAEKLLEIKWWDWDEKWIYEAIPLLQSSSFEELFAFYEKNVRGCEE